MFRNKLRSDLLRRVWYLVLGSTIVAAAGCSSTLVVLVPDPGGKVGEVSVTTETGTRILTAAGESTIASSAASPPNAAKVLEDELIVSVFGPALDNEPMPPERYMLYFYFDKTDLRPKSHQKLQGINQAVAKRQLCDISVNGHTDRMGTAEHNHRLSMQRARRVKSELIKLGLDEACMKIRYYGESDPLVPTEDGVAKRVNRRVEIEIR